MSFLLDTNVICEFAKGKPDPSVIAWLGSVPSTDAWFTTLVLRYRSRILPFDEQSADQWGRIMALHPTVPVEDSQLVATALQHDLTFATRNVRHIAKTGVAFINPF